MQTQDVAVLLVDDEILNIDLLSELLSMNGFYNIHYTTDPRKVMALCDKYQIKLILLDINMPYMNGFEVIKCLRKEYYQDNIAVVVLSAQDDAETQERVAASGASGFFTKPFIHEELICCINNLLEV